MPKAVRFHKLGGPEVLQIEEVPVRHPEAGEVAIDVAAVGLNRAESMYYHGNYLECPANFVPVRKIRNWHERSWYGTRQEVST